VAPKGLPEPIRQKLMTAVKKVTDGEDFQKLLKHLDLPYDFKDGKNLAKDVVDEDRWYKEFLPKMGAKVID
jgi:tripartite-type tricarboxylate transporter receptor subunit TctC